MKQHQLLLSSILPSILFVVLSTLLFTGCLSTDIVYGKGDLVTTTYEINEYSGCVNIDLAVPITIDSGDASVCITTDDNLQRYIRVDTTSGTISISLDSTYDLKMTDLSVAVTIPYLDSIQLNNCKFETEMSLPDTTSIRLSGTSSFTCGYLKVDTIDVHVDDLASVHLTGSTKKMNLQITSPLEQTLTEFTADQLMIDINSDKNTTMNVWSHIDGKLDGSGDFQILFDTPLNAVETFGDGEVVFMNSLPNQI